MDRRRYDSAMFWLAFGTAAAVIGLALMTIGATRSASGANLLASIWFDTGLGLLGLGALLLLWALGLYLARRREGDTESPAAKGRAQEEAVRGYFAERERLFKMWERGEKGKPKSK